MFSVVDARALSRAAASDIPEWYITKSGQEPKSVEYAHRLVSKPLAREGWPVRMSGGVDRVWNVKSTYRKETTYFARYRRNPLAPAAGGGAEAVPGVHTTIMQKLSLTYYTHNSHRLAPAFFACNTLKSQVIMRVSPDISIIAFPREVLWEPSQSFAGVHDGSSSLKRVLLLDQRPLVLRSETISTHFACNTLAIVSVRTRRIPLIGSKTVRRHAAPQGCSRATIC
jgi:hypothetical protein